MQYMHENWPHCLVWMLQGLLTGFPLLLPLRLECRDDAMVMFSELLGC